MTTTQQAPQAPSIDDLILAQLQYEASVTEQAEDLTTATLDKDSEFGGLTWGMNHFELNEWAARQLCRLTRIPYGVYSRASANLVKDLYSEFVKGVKDPQVKLSIKHHGKKPILRGILPLNHSDVKNSVVLQAIKALGPQATIDAATWYDHSSPQWLHTRVVLGQLKDTVNGEILHIGIDTTCSDVGGGPMQISLLLFRPICANGASITYGQKPYFYYNYSDQLVVDLTDIVTASLKRAEQDVPFVMQRVQAAMDHTLDLDGAKEILTEQVKNNVLNKGIAVKTMATIEKDGCKSLWDLVNAVTSQARSFREELRLRYERGAGFLMGLDIPRNQDEESYAKDAPLLLPELAIA